MDLSDFICPGWGIFRKANSFINVIEKLLPICFYNSFSFSQNNILTVVFIKKSA